MRRHRTESEQAARQSPALAPRLNRTAILVGTGLRMMLHDRLRFVGTLLGVVFSVLISVQQLGVLGGLLERNTQFVSRSGADIWIAPPETDLLEPGPSIARSVVDRTRVTPGVAIAAPLVFAGASVRTPSGGAESITLVGTDLTSGLGGPWNLVAGDAESLARTDTMIFEESRRIPLGGLNLGSVREVAEREVRVGGFTWGLQAFAPAFAFAEIDLARELVGLEADEQQFVLARVDEGVDPDVVAERLAGRLAGYKVLTRQAFQRQIVRTLLAEQLGVSFATSTFFGLMIGFVVVALAMFSAVLEREKELATLKSIGCTNVDLSILVMSTACAYGLLGSFVGLGVVTRLADAIRRPELVIVISDALIFWTPVAMLGITLAAALLALTRVWRVEPGMVFR